MGKIAVIDVETTLSGEAMSIGVVVADDSSYKEVASMYYILDPECKCMGLFSYALIDNSVKNTKTDSREAVIHDLRSVLKENNVSRILAYNASFDKNALPELSDFIWCDIMKLAAYKEFNKKIPKDAPCCKSGRLKSGYGVEPMLSLLDDNPNYIETHNAYHDAHDELKIVRLLGHPISVYDRCVI